jgi:hypothetical protein
MAAPEIDLDDRDDGEIARKLILAIAAAVRGEGTWIVRGGKRIAMILPPDVALRALARLHEDQRLSEIATAAAGLPPEAARLPEPGETVIIRPPGQRELYALTAHRCGTGGYPSPEPVTIA